MIPADHPLSARAVDAIWRISNHPGTLTHEWYRGIIDAMASAEHYVELVGIVATVNSVDRFAGIVDLDPIALPRTPIRSAQPRLGERRVHALGSHGGYRRTQRTARAERGTRGLGRAIRAGRGQYVPGDALLLGLSGLDVDEQIDPALLAEGAGVPEGKTLVRFVTAIGVGGDELAQAKDELGEAMDHDCLIDAAAVAANFYMMTRIADGTGTPLDEGDSGHVGRVAGGSGHRRASTRWCPPVSSEL